MLKMDFVTAILRLDNRFYDGGTGLVSCSFCVIGL